MRSFRARLTIWNVVVIALALIGFSAGIIYANQIRLSGDIDRELRDRALHAPPGPPNGGFGGRGGQGGGPGEDGQPGGQGLPPRFNDPGVIRFADVRRPRRFDLQGHAMGPMQDEPFDVRALNSALHGHASYSKGEYDGEPIRIYTLPLRDGQELTGAIQVARETRDLDLIWSAQLRTLLLFLPGAILGAAAGAFFLTNRAIRPIARMKSAANAISEEDLSQRLAVEGQDEFAELGATFNAMVARLEDSFGKQKAAYQSLQEALDAQKRFTADASHELRTPLTRLRLAMSSAIALGASAQDKDNAIQVADKAAESMGRLVQEMLVLARADAGQLRLNRERLDLRVIATDVLANFSPGEISLVADLQDSPVMIDGDCDHLERVVTNLIENALRFTPAGGEVKIKVCRDNQKARLTLTDTGRGIAADHLPHIKERFYRGDDARGRSDGGCGLGLAICEAIVVAHTGTLKIESQVGAGTTVTITLPIA